MCVQRILILGKGTASQTRSLEKKKDKKKKTHFFCSGSFCLCQALFLKKFFSVAKIVLFHIV